jgi:hypothetical protein
VTRISEQRQENEQRSAQKMSKIRNFLLEVHYPQELVDQFCRLVKGASYQRTVAGKESGLTVQQVVEFTLMDCRKQHPDYDVILKIFPKEKICKILED